MLIGVTPFYNRNRNVMLMKIQNSKVVFPDQNKYNISFSKEIQDLICKLLAKDKTKRLGATGDVDEILAHPFFASLDREAVLAKKVRRRGEARRLSRSLFRSWRVPETRNTSQQKRTLNHWLTR